MPPSTLAKTNLSPYRKLGTTGLSAGIGIHLLFGVNYDTLPIYDKPGQKQKPDHVLTGLQNWYRTTVDQALLGDLALEKNRQQLRDAAAATAFQRNNQANKSKNEDSILK
mmetsp:Transcript_22590/g.26060  ORF Transcript_22590/g.26060 Transcript_22590/m.26060 type:complete len:110 (-) Transcript_22590:582-911(-)